MTVDQALCIERGVTAVIGSGGKTSLLCALSQELRACGTVLLCTTTRMYPVRETHTLYAPTEEGLRRALEAFHVVCIGTPAEQGKLAVPELTISTLCKLADYVLVEADGSKGLPLKAHAAHEPVIPFEANQTICVVGLSGLGKPIQQAAHRADRYAKLAGAALSDRVTPELAARVLTAEGLGDRFFLNQADSVAEQSLGWVLQARLTAPAVIGSLQKGIILC